MEIIDIDDLELRCDLWNRKGFKLGRDKVQLVEQLVLFWLFGMGVSDEFLVAEVTCRYVQVLLSQ